VIGNYVFDKTMQPKMKEDTDWKEEFKPD